MGLQPLSCRQIFSCGHNELDEVLAGLAEALGSQKVVHSGRWGYPLHGADGSSLLMHGNVAHDVRAAAHLSSMLHQKVRML